MSEDNDARAWARFICGANAIFKDIAIGGRFHFASNDAKETCTKINDLGWYTLDKTGRKFRTGSRAAVIAE